jgi:cell division protein FtsW (lipid II flippase)
MNSILQRRLLLYAAVFLGFQAAIITLSSTVKWRSWDSEYHVAHWIALAIWGLFIARAHRDIVGKLPDTDPYLLPAAALLSGWGILTIWRLDSQFGARQTVWFSISVATFALGTRLASLDFIRRYKYLLLTCGLILTALTLLFGTNPGGIGPRLWLGYGELYLQPSEPLKLFLIAFLAAYLADKIPARLRTVHILFPTVVLSGIVVLLLVVQRDLGTAAIFTALYTIIIYLTTGRKRILFIALFLLIVASLAGYSFLGIVRARVDSWLNPWEDPSGASYQIVQSLIAIANGGIIGAGPGLGNPTDIPVVISDSIYAAIGEETGLIGTLGLLAIINLIITRALRVALRAPDLFRRILAAGVAIYFGVQTILIVGGNLRLLPLTGVTLPFVSYGGSSLLTSFIGLLILVHISNHMDADPAPLLKPQPYLLIGALLSLGLFSAMLTNGWWSVVRGPDLVTRADNRRLLLEERFVPRGALLDNDNNVIVTNKGNIGTYTRMYMYPDLAPVTGYTNPTYGQTGLEATLDAYLRGDKGNSTGAIWWNNLLYGTNPPGLDVRLSIDLYLQSRADAMLAEHHGAVILLNAQTGEILAMASHPTYDPGNLNDNLLTDPNNPLINRASQGQYRAEAIMSPFIAALHGNSPSNPDLEHTFKSFGFFQTPVLELPVTPAIARYRRSEFRVSPLQMSLAAAALSNNGVIPAPRIAMAVNTPLEGWISLPALGTPVRAYQSSAWDEAVTSYLASEQSFWRHIGVEREDASSITWFIGGTLPNWHGTPLAVVVLVEEDNRHLAERIGRELVIDAMVP